MKYRVMIPSPSAKRMAGTGTLIIEYDYGWGEAGIFEQPLDHNQTCFDFHIDDSTEWVQSAKCIDGTTFDVYIEYSNVTNSRKERVTLVPEVIQ